MNPGLNWPECVMTRANPPCTVHRAVVHGEVPAAVARYEEFVDASLIVLSSGRRSSWKDLWRVSMLERIVEATDKPVLAGDPERKESSFLKAYPRILCVLHLAEERHPAEDIRGLIEFAQALAEPAGGEIVLFATTSREKVRSHLRRAEDSPPPLSADAALDQLDQLGATLRVPSHNVVSTRSAHLSLRRAIRENDVDLVVAQRHGRGSGPRAGFDFSALLRNISCPLLSISPHTLSLRAALPRAATEALAPAAQNG